MLFGKKNVEESVPLENLLTELNASFNKRLSKFSSKSKHIADDLNAISSKFIEECDKFEDFSGKPEDTDEYTGLRMDPHVLDSQKKSYTKALRGIMSSKQDIHADNEYSFYEKFLKDIKDKKERVLKANNTFRNVFVSYPKHLNKFKDVFSVIDKDISRLEYEMERVNQDHEKYETIAGMISNLESETTKQKHINSDITELKSNQVRKEAKPPVPKSTDSDMAEIKKSISSMDSKILRETQDINAIFLHLERSARKYDYIVGKRGKLLDFVLDPVRKIHDASSYGVLERELLSLKDAIDKDEVQIKNAEETMDHISHILKSDIPDRINNIRKLKSDRNKLSGELAGMFRVAEELKKGEDDMKKKRENLSELESDLNECEGRIAELKESIKEEFLKSYGKAINIT